MKNRNRLISHLRISFCALVIVGALLTLSRAEAGTPQPASGQFFPCFNYAGPPRQVGENLIITFNISGTSNGTFTGTFSGTELNVVHRDGSITKHGSLVLNGSITGRSGTGTLHFTYEGIGSAVTGLENLHGVGTQGTGGLAGVHVNLTLEGDVGAPNPGCAFSGTGTYNGQILFAP